MEYVRIRNKKQYSAKDYPDIDFTHFKISLIEESKDTLNSMSISLHVTNEKRGENIITETL